MLLATAAEQFDYKLMYAEYLGGSVAFFWSHFNQINGYLIAFSATTSLKATLCCCGVSRFAWASDVQTIEST